MPHLFIDEGCFWLRVATSSSLSGSDDEATSTSERTRRARTPPTLGYFHPPRPSVWRRQEIRMDAA